MVNNILLVFDDFDPIRRYKLSLVERSTDIVDINTVVFLYEQYKKSDRVFENEEKIALLGATLSSHISSKYKYLIDGDSFREEKSSILEKIKRQKKKNKNSILYLLIDSKEYLMLRDDKEFKNLLTLVKPILFIFPEDYEILGDINLSSTQLLIISYSKELDEASEASVLNVKKEYFDSTVIEYMNKSSECAIKRIKSKMSDQRFKHCLRVAGTIKRICELSGITDNELKYNSYLAALYHDICKEIPFKIQIEIAKKILKIENFISAKVLHGPIGAWYMKEKYFFENEEIMEAVSQHTIPDENPKEITMLLFLADHLEPNKRERFDGEIYERIWGLIEKKEIKRSFDELQNYLKDKRKNRTRREE